MPSCSRCLGSSAYYIPLFEVVVMLNATADLLRKRAQEATFRIQTTEANMNNRLTQEKTMRNCSVAVKNLEAGIREYRGLIQALTSYLDERRQQGHTAIMSAMQAAAYIVPSCDGTILPKVEDGEAWFETQDGIDVSRLEGGGYRSILSVLMRAVVLRANTNCLQTLVLDELFAKLSVENSVTLSGYLPILAQDMQIISIEQKPEVFAKTPHVSYRFYLDGDHTKVQREVVSNG